MPPLLVESENGIVRIRLDRADKANALDAPLVEAMLASVVALDTTTTRLLVLEGVGRNFCAGFDFSGYESASEGALLLRFVRIEQLLQAIAHAPVATLALAQGGCFGAGADLFCACEMRVCAPDARFRMPGLRFGIALGTRRLAAQIGPDAARRMLATGDPLEAAEAHSLGIATSVASPGEWPSIVASAASIATRLAPEAGATLRRLTMPDTRDADLADLVRTVAVPGIRERIRAFRSPH